MQTWRKGKCRGKKHELQQIIKEVERKEEKTEEDMKLLRENNQELTWLQ